MKKTKTATLIAAPTMIVAGALPNDIARNLRVVDADSGETIERVLDADADAGTLRRHEVTDGNLVREGDSFRVVEEKRAIRIEWIEPPIADEGGTDGSPAPAGEA